MAWDLGALSGQPLYHQPPIRQRQALELLCRPCAVPLCGGHHCRHHCGLYLHCPALLQGTFEGRGLSHHDPAGVSRQHPLGQGLGCLDPHGAHYPGVPGVGGNFAPGQCQFAGLSGGMGADGDLFRLCADGAAGGAGHPHGAFEHALRHFAALPGHGHRPFGAEAPGGRVGAGLCGYGHRALHGV